MHLLEQKLCCAAVVCAEARVKGRCEEQPSLASDLPNEGDRAEADKQARQPSTPFSVSHIDESFQQYNNIKVS